MKKSIFILLAVCTMFSLHSCMDDGCKFEGKWKVESADVKSTKFSPSILEMTKEGYLVSKYDFSKDGKITVTAGEGQQPKVGIWSFDETTQEIKWSNNEGDPMIWAESFQVVNCASGVMTLSQRIPADPAKEALAEVTVVIKKGE